MTSSSKLVVANWKSNLNWQEAISWAESFERAKKHDHTYIICPPSPLLGALQKWTPRTFSLGVQDLSPFESGAYTGAVSAGNLVGLHVNYVILGHSERRRYFAETAQSVAQKAEIALNHQITPIICVDVSDFEEQTRAVSHLAGENIVWAYEPVHAISTFGGQEDPLEVTLDQVQKLREFADAKHIIYGGSVSPENSLAYLNSSQIDGILVGSASLKADLFAQL